MFSIRKVAYKCLVKKNLQPDYLQFTGDRASLDVNNKRYMLCQRDGILKASGTCIPAS